MQGVVRRLKERRLVDSRPDPGDARRTLLSLTTEGQRLVNKLLINGPAVSRETLKPLNVQEQRHLIELLSNVESLSPPQRASGEESFDMVVPAMKAANFHFTEVTRF